MLTSIVVPKMYQIETTKGGKFEVNGETLAIKDTPFVRYRFTRYSDEEIKYIKNMQEKFNRSAHLVEISLDGQTEEATATVLNNLNNICTFLYINVFDEGIKAETMEELVKISNTMSLGLSGIVGVYDRIMLRDKTTSMNATQFNQIIEVVSGVTRYSKDKIGICSSPLSFNGMACLTAVRARELASIHCENGDLALPTGKHECMESCGCIRHIVLTSDILSGKEKVTKKKASETIKTSKALKRPKGGIPMW